MLPGSGKKPADVHAHGYRTAIKGRDIVIDVAIVDSQSDGINAELQRLALAKGIAARRKGGED